MLNCTTVQPKADQLLLKNQMLSISRLAYVLIIVYIFQFKSFSILSYVTINGWVGLAKRYHALQGGSKTADFGVT
jgi:hypothetical protein